MIDDVFDSLHPVAKLNSKKMNVIQKQSQLNKNTADLLTPIKTFALPTVSPFGFGLGLATTMPILEAVSPLAKPQLLAQQKSSLQQMKERAKAKLLQSLNKPAVP